jgi:Cu(I)/Ag(I) efflux system membrane protein CusA/SilA
MELTGIKTAVGLKVQGPDLARIQDIGAQIQQILSGMPDTSSIFAERVSQGFYLNVEVNRPEAARYGLTVADVQRVITSEIGGASIAQNVEGRERFPIAVRYERDFRDNPEMLNRALIGTVGRTNSINQVAHTCFSRGPAMIRDKDRPDRLRGLDLKTKDYGGFVSRADKLLKEKLFLPEDTPTAGLESMSSNCGPRNG